MHSIWDAGSSCHEWTDQMPQYSTAAYFSNTSFDELKQHAKRLGRAQLGLPEEDVQPQQREVSPYSSASDVQQRRQFMKRKTIVVNHLLDGKLGINLRTSILAEEIGCMMPPEADSLHDWYNDIAGVVIVGFSIPAASDFGWQLFDEIVAVNGEPVSDRDAFAQAYAKAKESLPIHFSVLRTFGPELRPMSTETLDLTQSKLQSYMARYNSVESLRSSDYLIPDIAKQSIGDSVTPDDADDFGEEDCHWKRQLNFTSEMTKQLAQQNLALNDELEKCRGNLADFEYWLLRRQRKRNRRKSELPLPGDLTWSPLSEDTIKDPTLFRDSKGDSPEEPVSRDGVSTSMLLPSGTQEQRDVVQLSSPDRASSPIDTYLVKGSREENGAMEAKGSWHCDHTIVVPAQVTPPASVGGSPVLEEVAFQALRSERSDRMARISATALAIKATSSLRNSSSRSSPDPAGNRGVLDSSSRESRDSSRRGSATNAGAFRAFSPQPGLRRDGQISPVINVDLADAISEESDDGPAQLGMVATKTEPSKPGTHLRPAVSKLLSVSNLGARSKSPKSPVRSLRPLERTASYKEESARRASSEDRPRGSVARDALSVQVDGGDPKSQGQASFGAAHSEMMTSSTKPRSKSPSGRVKRQSTWGGERIVEDASEANSLEIPAEKDAASESKRAGSLTIPLPSRQDGNASPRSRKGKSPRSRGAKSPSPRTSKSPRSRLAASATEKTSRGRSKSPNSFAPARTEPSTQVELSPRGEARKSPRAATRELEVPTIRISDHSDVNGPAAGVAPLSGSQGAPPEHFTVEETPAFQVGKTKSGGSLPDGSPRTPISERRHSRHSVGIDSESFAAVGINSESFAAFMGGGSLEAEVVSKDLGVFTIDDPSQDPHAKQSSIPPQAALQQNLGEEDKPDIGEVIA